MAETSSTTTSQREGYTVTSRQLPPELAAQLKQKTNDFSALSTSLQAQLKALTDGMLSDNDAAKLAIDQSTAAKTQTVEAQSEGAQATLDTKSKILSIFGIDVANDPDNIIAKNVALARGAHNERVQLQDQVTQLQSESPFTNPVGWLVNNIKAAPLITRHNNLLQQENTASNQIERAQNEANNQIALQPAATKDLINKQKIAAINETLAAAEQEKLKLTGAMRAHVAQNIIAASHMAGQDLTAFTHLADLQTRTVSSTFSDTTKVSATDKKEQDFLRPINAVLAQYSLPPFQNTYMFSRLKKDTQDTLIAMTQFGRAGVDPGKSVAAFTDLLGTANLGKVASDAPDAAKFLQSTVKSGSDYLDALEAKAGRQDGDAIQKLKGVKQGEDRLALGINLWAKDMANEVKAGNMLKVSKDNPYKLDYLRVAVDPALQQNPISAALLSRPKGTQVDDQLILSIGTADVLNGKKTAGQVAQETADFYRTGLQRQRVNRAMDTVGFVPIGDYQVVTKTVGSKALPVDMTNPVSLEQYLTNQIAQHQVLEYMHRLPPPN